MDQQYALHCKAFVERQGWDVLMRNGVSVNVLPAAVIDGKPTAVGEIAVNRETVERAAARLWKPALSVAFG